MHMYKSTLGKVPRYLSTYGYSLHLTFFSKSCLNWEMCTCMHMHLNYRMLTLASQEKQHAHIQRATC